MLGWAVLGIWPPGADGSDVNSAHRNGNRKYLATGDDFGQVKIFNYPCAQVSDFVSLFLLYRTVVYFFSIYFLFFIFYFILFSIQCSMVYILLPQLVRLTFRFCYYSLCNFKRVSLPLDVMQLDRFFHLIILILLNLFRQNVLNLQLNLIPSKVRYELLFSFFHYNRK